MPAVTEAPVFELLLLKIISKDLAVLPAGLQISKFVEIIENIKQYDLSIIDDFLNF